MFTKLPRIESGRDFDLLRIAAGQQAIHVAKGRGKECKEVATSVPAGTPNRRQLIVEQLKARGLTA
jgi:hypothetical protein